MQYWSKSILSIHRYLETLSKAIDGLVKKNSKVSNSMGNNSTYMLASKIIEWTDKKKKMINLKVATIDALKKVNKESRRILILFYIDGVKGSTIADLLGCSIRTYYRKKKLALDRFAIALKSVGYDEEYLTKHYGNEKWLMSVYDKCLERDTITQDTAILEEDKSIMKGIIKDLKYIKCYLFSTYV